MEQVPGRTGSPLISPETAAAAEATGLPVGEIWRRHRAVQDALRWFTFGHLTGPARTVSRACAILAGDITGEIAVDDPELTAGLRKLLEAKDCFVRAAIAAGKAGSE